MAIPAPFAPSEIAIVLCGVNASKAHVLIDFEIFSRVKIGGKGFSPEHDGLFLKWNLCDVPLAGSVGAVSAIPLKSLGLKKKSLAGIGKNATAAM
jgi:hypothetical protein